MGWRRKRYGKGIRWEGDKNTKGITDKKEVMIFSIIFEGLCAVLNADRKITE
jgi:hypothetical protein